MSGEWYAVIGLGVVGLILLVVGILMIVFGFRKKDRCVYRSKAVISDVIEHKRTKKDGTEKIAYEAVYRYEYGEETFIKESNVSKAKKPKLGKKKTVYINPNKPKECYMRTAANVFVPWLISILGLAFVVAAFVVMFKFAI